MYKRQLEKLDFTEVRGLDGIKEAAVDLNGTILKVVVAHGLGNARKLMELLEQGKRCV